MFLSKLFRSHKSDSREGKRRFVETYLGQLLLVFIGATFSIVLTIEVAYLMEKHKRKQDRRMSVVMVLSNIEIFARTLESYGELLASNDSVATWLLNKPIEDLELMPEEELNSLIDQATNFLFLSRDKTAENNFSNNSDTWKIVDNLYIIDRVGKCFSAMNTVEDYWNNRVKEVNQTILDIKDHPENYEGNTIPIKILRSTKIRRTFNGIHYLRTYFSYVAATMRYHNRYNMAAINITERELMEYTDVRELQMENPNEAPDFTDFYTEPISFDSLITFRELDMYLDSLKGL